MPTRRKRLTPSWTSSSITIAADGQPMPVACTETGLPFPLAGVAEHPALAVALDGVVEVGLRDVLRAQRVAGEQAGLGVVAGLGSDVDRHGGEPRVSRRMDTLIEPALDEILAFCAEDPIERVFLEDVARRGLGRFTGARARTARLARSATSARTSSRPASGCGAFAGVDGARRARMVIGEEHAVGDFWAAARHRLPRPARGPAGPAGLRARRAAGARARRACARRRTTTSSSSSRPARKPTARSSGSTRSSATPTASAGGRGRRSTRAARGSGARTARSCSRRKRRRGRPSAVQLQQVWVDPAVARPRLRAARACATSAGSCSSACRPSACSSAPRTRRRSGSTRTSACGTRSRTAASSSLEKPPYGGERAGAILPKT